MAIDYLSWLIIALFLLSGVVLVVLGRRAQQQRAIRQQSGLALLANLREMLAAMQKHRGLSSGYLNGSTGLIGEINAIQSGIDHKLNELNALSEWFADNQAWENIETHWSRLAEKFKMSEVENNLLQHNNLIQNVLYLMDDMAREHDLLLIKDDKNRAMYVLWRDLLATAEYIGQARAVGTAVSAAGVCTSVARIQLNFLCRKIESMISGVWQAVDGSGASRTVVDQLLQCINRQVIVDKPTIEATEYFAIASRALDGLYVKFDNMLASYSV